VPVHQDLNSQHFLVCAYLTYLLEYYSWIWQYSCINSLKEKRPNGEYVDVEFLKKFSNECPAFLSPALILKTLCMEVTTGSRFWEKKLRERKEAQNQSYVSKDTLVKRASRRMMWVEKFMALYYHAINNYYFFSIICCISRAFLSQ
jgi:hypothetical protein